MYDVTNEDSFLQMQSLFKNFIYFYCPKTIELMILGNKKDLNEYKKVSIDNVKKVNFKEFKISFNSFSF